MIKVDEMVDVCESLSYLVDKGIMTVALACQYAFKAGAMAEAKDPTPKDKVK